VPPFGISGLYRSVEMHFRCLTGWPNKVGNDAVIASPAPHIAKVSRAAAKFFHCGV
jgi:hypothetical protein